MAAQKLNQPLAKSRVAPEMHETGDLQTVHIRVAQQFFCHQQQITALPFEKAHSCEGIHDAMQVLGFYIQVFCINRSRFVGLLFMKNTVFIYFWNTLVERIMTSFTGRSFLSVLTSDIFSTISKPSTTSPKIVTEPSRCGTPPTVL